MFFGDVLLKDKDLKKVWLEGNYQKIEDDKDKTSLPKVCNKLGKWFDGDYRKPKRSMSLRTSAVMVHGTVMLYKKQLQELLDESSILASTLEASIGTTNLLCDKASSSKRKSPDSVDSCYKSPDSVDSCYKSPVSVDSCYPQPQKRLRLEKTDGSYD